ncbi:putative cation-transporting ATPase 13A5 isoform X3 [Arvicanthis niloticus]|uniref:putative cation-transporting ATPase 13A5 isoform X3 n=1 Tax=Arvicanthis niloticus TaxID=61156 RepID=UPI00402B419F
MEKSKKDDHQAVLNEGEENELEVFGYHTQNLRRALCLVTAILTLGAVQLMFYWRPEWWVWTSCIPCPLQEADTVLLRTTDEFRRYMRKKVFCLHLSTLKFPISKNPEEPLVADHHSVINQAVMKPELKLRCIQVQKIRLLEDSNSCFDIHHTFGLGLTSEEQEVRRLVCGPNAIEVEIQPIWKLLVKQVLNPFYVFQAFTLTLWLSQGYIEYSVAIIILTVISIVLSVYDLRQQSVKLHKLVEDHNKVQVTITVRDKGLQELESRLLVPGDILILPGKISLPCDAVLIDGSCVVNEGMLTGEPISFWTLQKGPHGESIPVTKTPLPQTENTMPWKSHSLEDYRKHVLFCGTEVIQVKPSGQGPVRAVVLQTGYNTAKGDLVRSILYPRPLNFKLYNDAFKFMVFLACIGVVGFFYALGVYMYHEVPPRETATMALILLTATVPPVLPAALTIGNVYAQKRLKKKKIFCISPQRINMCGQINLVCFDKTGTLTEDGLDLWGTVPTAGNCFQAVHSFASGEPVPWGPLCAAMTSCHSLILLDGTIQGDPLDLKMFEGTGWNMEDGQVASCKFGMSDSSPVIKPGPEASQSPVDSITILRQFPFSSGLQRMSVIAQLAGDLHLHVYMKGAPEMVARFCCSETVPENFLQELRNYTVQGFRVIALAHKTLKMERLSDVDRLAREKVESELTFLGLLIMENRLKKETRPVLKELSEARIRTVMVTGDNLQTAITVAKNSEMIPLGSQVIIVEANEPGDLVPASVTWQLVGTQEPGSGKKDTYIDIGNSCVPGGKGYHFAMSGKSYQVLFHHFYSMLPQILVNGTIFARMSPGQKSSLVEEFQKLNYYVGMCGDGANDCGALKMAHAGISLSEQEASVASPFTSKTANIECVPHLIREGRAALVSSFGVFKYLTMYGIIQFIGTSLLYWQLQLFGNYQYLLQDVAITLMVSLTMSINHAYPKLAPYRPAGQLLSPQLLLSVFMNSCFTCIVLVSTFLSVKQQPWYCEVYKYSECFLANQSNFSTNTSLEQNWTGNATLVPASVLSFEGTTLWPIVTFNCISAAFIFSKGKPFRKPIYTNYLFSLLLTSAVGLTLFILFSDFQDIYRKMEFIPTTMSWRISILVAAFVQFCVAFFVEDAILQNRELWLLIKKEFGFYSKSQYRVLQRKLAEDPTWPPTNRTDYAVNGKNGFYINRAYESPEEVPKGKLTLGGQASEQHFWTRL